MERSEFGKWAKKATDWSAEYIDSLSDRPVRPNITPGQIAEQIGDTPPELPEEMALIFDDFERIIPNGMTHWQHPRFFAYFPGNAAPAAIIAEYLASTMAANTMLWQTSPAGTELELKMIDWLRQAVGLPSEFQGSFQDTASSATLCAVLTMREKALQFNGNQTGLAGQPRLRIYASDHNHTSVDKALWVSGIGQDNLVKIPSDQKMAMKPELLKAAIKRDREQGFLPAGIVAVVGGTSIGGSDNVAQICAIAKEEGLYTHLDAAWAGSAMICPEFRPLWEGVAGVDSLVFNPHKWLGAPLECSAHYVREPALLNRAMAIKPSFLKTPGQDDIVNFSEWSVQLGRRFRALKVWFLLRAYGLEGLRTRIRNHVKWSQDLCEKLRAEPDFEIVTEPVLSLFSFRHKPDSAGDDELNTHNLDLVNRINSDGRIYLTQGTHNGDAMIRFQAGQFDMREEDADMAFSVITSLARMSGTSTG